MSSRSWPEGWNLSYPQQLPNENPRLRPEEQYSALPGPRRRESESVFLLQDILSTYDKPPESVSADYLYAISVVGKGFRARSGTAGMDEYTAAALAFAEVCVTEWKPT